MTLEELQAYCAPEWDRIQTHPFVVGIGQGTLPDEKLRYFIGQDALYLRDFYRVLSLIGGRLTPQEGAKTLIHHAETVFLVENTLHDAIARYFHMTPDDLQKVPLGWVTKGYRDHLVRTAYTESVAVSVAAVLPCYWTYQAIGQKLAPSLPEHPWLKEWILTYAGEAYGTAVAEVVHLFEHLPVAPAEEAKIRESYHWSMVYERRFWDQAWSSGQH